MTIATLPLDTPSFSVDSDESENEAPTPVKTENVTPAHIIGELAKLVRQGKVTTAQLAGLEVATLDLLDAVEEANITQNED